MLRNPLTATATAEPSHDERADLPVTEQVLLWSLRAWVAGALTGTDVADRIRAMLGRLTGAELFPYVDGFMWVLSRASARQIDIGCVCRCRVSSDELALLEVIRLHQHDRVRDADAILGDMMVRAGVLAARDSAWRIAALLAHARRFLSPEPASGVRLH